MPPSEYRRYPCPCCGYWTILDRGNGPPGTYDICPVCGWEDDPVQFDDPDYTGGANDLSLNEVRQAFLDWQAAGMPEDPRRRPPTAEEATR